MKTQVIPITIEEYKILIAPMIKMKEYYLANEDKIKQRSKKYRLANKDKIKEYYLSNKQKKKEYDKKYYLNKNSKSLIKEDKE